MDGLAKRPSIGMCSRRTSGTESPQSDYSSMPSPPTVIAPYNTPAEPYNQDGPYLKIIEQPQTKFRFRYKSEMIGTHGQLKAEASDKNRAKYPTVKLCNWYGGDALIRLTLFTGEANTNERKRHVHELSGKTVNQDTGVCEVPVSKDSNFEGIFQYLGIIHIAKRDVKSIIERRKFEDLVNHAMIRKSGLTRDDAERNITQQDREKISKEAGDEANNIDLNKVVLRFQAFQGTPSGAYQPITMHVDSEYVYNLKNAWTGELKIVRMSAVSGPCTGNQEVYLLVEKVKKSNIKVKFIELSPEGHEVWSDYGNFSDNDVHHQFAIVFRTPRYRTTDLSEPIKVLVQLERTSDSETSEPREFTFLPVGRKRTLNDTELILTDSEGTVYDKQNTRKRFREVNMEPLDLRHYTTHRGPEDNIITSKGIPYMLNSPFDIGVPEVNAPQSNMHQVPSPGMSDLGSPGSNTMYSPQHGVPVLSSSISQSNNSEYQSFQGQYNNSPSPMYTNSPSPASLSVPSPQFSNQPHILSSSPTEGASPNYVYSPVPISVPSMTPSQVQVSTSPHGQQEYLQQQQQHHQPQQLPQQTILVQQQQLQQQPHQIQKTFQHQVQQQQLPQQQQQQQLQIQQQQMQPHQQLQAQQQIWSGSVVMQQQQQPPPRQNFPIAGDVDLLDLIGGDTSGPDLLDLIDEGVFGNYAGNWSTDYTAVEPKKSEMEGSSSATGRTLVVDGAGEVADKMAGLTINDKNTSSQAQASRKDVAFRVAVSAAECLQAYAATNDISLLLASHKYLLAVQNNQGDNALHTAVSNKNWDAFNKILKASEKVQPQDLLLNAQNFALETPLHLAVHGGEIEMVARLMEVPGCNIAICDANGNTVLHEAARQWDTHCLNFLLTRPTNGNRTALTQAVNSYNYHGETPLHMAAACGNLNAVRLLLGAGAQVHLCERKRGANALHIAVMCGHFKIVSFLIHHTNVTIEAGMFDGNTALHLAVQAEDKEMCRLLMRAKADPHAKNCLRKRTKTEDSDEESEDEDEEQLEKKTGKEEDDDEDREFWSPLDYAIDNAELVAILRGEEMGYVEAAAAAEAAPEKSKDYSDSANFDSGINISVTDVTPTNAYELNDSVRSRLASHLGGDSWRRLAERLNLDHVIPSLRASSCPASQLLQLDSMKSISLQKLRECLHKLGLKHCEAILDDL